MSLMLRQGKLPNIFQDLENEWFPTLSFSRETGLEISEDNQNVYIEAALPGLTPNDIEITFEKGELWIKGEKKTEESDKQKKFYRRSSKSYSYNLAVPGTIDETQEPMAAYENGMMIVTFKKRPTAQPKKIKIQQNKK